MRSNSGPSAAPGRATLLIIVVAMALAISPASAETKVPHLIGDEREGVLSLSLHRGAAVPFELLVIATPNQCEGEIQLTLSWSESKNRVRVRLRGENVLEPFPDVERTAGVDFLPNAFFPEPEDIDNGVISSG